VNFFLALLDLKGENVEPLSDSDFRWRSHNNHGEMRAHALLGDAN
jgi:hypothetical protein